MSDLLKVLSFVFRYSRRIRGSGAMITLVVVTGLASGLANTGLIALINTTLSGTGVTAADLGWAFLAFLIGLPTFRFISQAVLIRLTQRVLLDLRLHLGRRILAAPLRQLEQIGPARLLATLTNDVGALTEAVAVLPLLFMHGGIVLSCLVYLGWLSPRLLLTLFGFLIFGVVTYQLPMLRALRYARLARESWDGLFRNIRAVAEGTKELKMHQPRRESFIEEDLRASADDLKLYSIRGATIFAAASSWGQVLFFVAIGLLLFVARSAWSLPNTVIVGYSMTLILLMTPLEVILTSVPRLASAAASARKIDDLGLSLANLPPEAAYHGPALYAPRWSELELAGVTHSYRRENEAESFTLGPVDLAFRPGELVFVVGGNGSGKTTLAKLLLGLYAPEQGEIRLDGSVITDANRDFYRQHFSAVFTDFYLFQRFTGLSRRAIEADSERYLANLQLAQKVRIENDTLSTVDLSQGQRKRLALLTAYLEDRPIYLFDEWAADQDPMFKEIFYRQLLPELKARGKTVIVISHDDRYYDAADRIVKLVYGQVEYDRVTRAPGEKGEAAEPAVVAYADPPAAIP